jgi:hypothetical protein
MNTVDDGDLNDRSKISLNEWKGLPLIMRLINSCAIMGYTSSRRNSL